MIFKNFSDNQKKKKKKEASFLPKAYKKLHFCWWKIKSFLFKISNKVNI